MNQGCHCYGSNRYPYMTSRYRHGFRASYVLNAGSLDPAWHFHMHIPRRWRQDMRIAVVITLACKFPDELQLPTWLCPRASEVYLHPTTGTRVWRSVCTVEIHMSRMAFGEETRERWSIKTPHAYMLVMINQELSPAV